MKVGQLIEALVAFDPEMQVGLADWSEQNSDPLVEWGESEMKVLKWQVWNQIGSSADIEKIDVEAIVLGATDLYPI